MESSDKSSIANLDELDIVSQTDAEGQSRSTKKASITDNFPTDNSKLSDSQTLMSFIKSNIGTGMLSMPVVLRYCGLWFLHSFFPTLLLNYYLVGFIVCMALIPVCLCGDMRMFAHLSLLANLATLLGTLLIFAYLFHSGLQSITSFPAIKDTQGVLIGFSVAMCAFEGISLILPIENKMAHPESYIQPFGVLSTGMTVIICVNTAVAFFGYLRFGDRSQGSITLNVPERPYWFAPVKPLFILAIVITYLMQFYIPATIIERLMEKLTCHRNGSDRRRSVNVKLMRIGLVILAYLMVITVPRLELMISLIGSFASSILAFVLPPALEIVHLWPRRHCIPLFWLKVFAKHLIFITIGLLTFVGGTTATLIQLIHAFSPAH